MLVHDTTGAAPILSKVFQIKVENGKWFRQHKQMK